MNSYGQEEIFLKSNIISSSGLKEESKKDYEVFKVYSSFTDFSDKSNNLSVDLIENKLGFNKNYSYTSSNGYFVWGGQNHAEESIILLKKDGRISGIINSDSGAYEILTLDNKAIVVGKLNNDTLGSCDTPPNYLKDDPFRISSERNDVSFMNTNVIQQYKLLLAYTPQFASSFGFNQNRINDFLELITETINQSYINSGTLVRTKLVFSYQTPDDEKGNKGDDLTHFWGRGPGRSAGPPGSGGKPDQRAYDEVFEYESRYNIEASILLVGYSDGGRASRNQRKAVASRNAAAAAFTAAHEIGHIFDLEHDRGEFTEIEAVIGGLDRKKAYGYTGNSSRTIMSRNSNPQFRRPQYSDPNNTFPEGDPSGRDNTRGNQYINNHLGRIVSKSDRQNENLTNITVTGNQMYDGFAHDAIQTLNFIVDPLARVRLAADRIILKLGTKFRRGSNVQLQFQQGIFPDPIFNSVPFRNEEMTFSNSQNEIDNPENFNDKYYNIYSENKTVIIQTKFPEKFDFTLKIDDLISGETLVNELKSSKEAAFSYNLSRHNGNFIKVSLIFSKNLVESKKMRL